MSYPTTGGSYVINDHGEFVKRQDTPGEQPQHTEQTPADPPEEQQPSAKEAKK